MFCVKWQHCASFVLYVVGVHNVFTICELRMLWSYLIGVKEKLGAFLTLTSRGCDCSSNSIVLGKLFHPVTEL